MEQKRCAHSGGYYYKKPWHILIRGITQGRRLGNTGAALEQVPPSGRQFGAKRFF